MERSGHLAAQYSRGRPAGGGGLYRPDANFRKAAARGGLPWDGAARALDRLGEPGAAQTELEQPPLGTGHPALANLPVAASKPNKVT